MADNPAFNQIEFIQGAVGIGPVAGDLPVALHGAQAPAHGFDLLVVDQLQTSTDLRMGQWSDAFVQIVEHKFAAWNRTLVALRFAAGVGIDRFLLAGHNGVFILGLVQQSIVMRLSLCVMGNRVKGIRRAKKNPDQAHALSEF